MGTMTLKTANFGFETENYELGEILTVNFELESAASLDGLRVHFVTSARFEPRDGAHGVIRSGEGFDETEAEKRSERLYAQIH